MRQADRWAAGRSGSFTAAFIPTVQEVQAGHWEEKGISLMAAARGAGLDVVDLLQVEPQLTPNHYYRYDPHWNPSGHAVVARQLLPNPTAIAKRTCSLV